MTFKFFRRLFTENLALKIFSLFLAIIAWFYIVNELYKGDIKERSLIQKVFPTQGIITKKLQIKPILVGKPKHNFRVVEDKILVVPDYCIVVGHRDILKDIKYMYTVPIDVNEASKTFTKSVSLTPIAPGIFTEETLVVVTVPIEKAQH